MCLHRPAVEAGEKLGFLPGDIAAKVNPYLRPLFDSLEDMMEFSQMKKFMEMDIIEIIPLAFMRGRTLNEACIICDEAQNTSPAQMLMFLTRMGRGSKMIITGDITQVDLARGEMSGMVDAVSTLDGIPGIGIVELSQADIVRHKLVHNIVQAYDKKNKRLAQGGQRVMAFWQKKMNPRRDHIRQSLSDERLSRLNRLAAEGVPGSLLLVLIFIAGASVPCFPLRSAWMR